MLNRLLVVLSLTLILSAPATAQAPTTPRAIKDPSSIALIQRALGVMGWQTAISQLDTLTTGTLVRGTTRLPIVIKTKGTKMLRVEIQRGDGTNVYIVNNGHAQIQSPDGRLRQVALNNSFGQRVWHIPALSLLAEYADAQIDIGATTLDNSPALSIPVAVIPSSADSQVQANSFRRLTKTTFLFNADLLVSEIRYNQYDEKPPHDPVPARIVFSDYRRIGPLFIPFHDTSYQGDTLDYDLYLDSVQFNVGLTDADFALSQEATNAK